MLELMRCLGGGYEAVSPQLMHLLTQNLRAPCSQAGLLGCFVETLASYLFSFLVQYPLSESKSVREGTLKRITQKKRCLPDKASKRELYPWPEHV